MGGLTWDTENRIHSKSKPGISRVYYTLVRDYVYISQLSAGIVWSGLENMLNILIWSWVISRVQLVNMLQIVGEFSKTSD